ncbi:MAG: acyltransferase family protein [Anaerolineae bacterium]|nr:acyltransferase family protein [Anaerolineae bacterium]
MMSAKVDITPTVAVQTVSQPRVRERILYLDVIRAYAILTVVWLHAAAPLAYEFNSLSASAWWVANLLDAIARPAVPLFLMVSGFLLLDPKKKDEPVSVFYRKRMLKVIVPFVGWASIYLAWRAIGGGEQFTPVEFIREIINGPVYYHLWFIYMMIGLYIVTPILRVYARHADTGNLTYFVLLWFVVASIVPALNKLLNLEIGIQFVVTTNLVGYFMLGHLLRGVKLNAKQFKIALLVIAGCIAFSAIGTYILTVRADGVLDQSIYQRDSPNNVVYAIALFLVIKSLDFKPLFQRYPRVQPVVSFLSAASGSIYFMHILVLELLAGGYLFGVKLSGFTVHPIVGIPLVTLVTVIICTLVIIILKKIPLARALVH